MLSFIKLIPEKLSRVTSGRKLIKEIDGLRFMAILPVLIQHMAERFERNTTINFTTPLSENGFAFLASRGFLGVYLFFVISGFILALPFASSRLNNTKKVKLSDYYWRRVTRLEPPYIFWITIFFLVIIFYGQRNFLEYLPHYLANLTYTHGLIYKEWSPINPPTWTLEIEIQFYILAPFLTHLFFSIKNKTLRRVCNLFIILGLMVAQQYLKFYANPANLSILGHLHYFLIGFMLADIYLCDWSTKIKKQTIYDFTAVLALGTLIYIFSWEFNFTNRILVVALLFTFFYSVFKGNYVNRFVSNKWIMSIGGMCYTIYLIHLPLAELIVVFTKNIHITNYYSVNLLVQLLIFLPIVLALSALFFLFFEKPFMNKDWSKSLFSNFPKYANSLVPFKYVLGRKTK
ncbi:acyltransferase family protein [Adhaeribacter radiodurans]|uniref:Acyltransferase n=1 Tax=Adhaeribacter radiodurans TaxID=2745197 RepID=A0A7L7L4H8_9BACT|nr:acyltransferase [Adhaeribacter radiodurans]QMU27707.1 acyltransferase [Adhaeribacter radiodurans]